ncbi:MAG: DUF177 domain-containing protein [bacterium]
MPSYSRGHHVLSEVLTPTEMELDISLFPDPIDVQIQLDRHDPYLRLDCQVSTQIHQVCDRCLTDFDNLLSAEGKLVFVLSSLPGREKLKEDELQYISPDTQDIDLSGDLRDILMLSLPTKSLCHDDCKGLCPRCGQNLNEGDCGCHGKELAI